jgi:nitroimidazol reductase NimA-like FMN-containing flavoprotein (pyridoxamine 5'-phosphate oxidase superfamily)
MTADGERYGGSAMTSAELDAFLDDADVLMLASLRRDGSPIVVPVGFDWDGTCFYVTIALDHAGVSRLRRDGRVSLAVNSHPSFPTKFVVVQGNAEEMSDPEGELSKRVLFRKSAELFAGMGIDRERYFREWFSVGRVAFRIDVTSIASFDGTKAGRGERYAGGTRLSTDRPATTAKSD